jgi:hypothetical protein
MQRERAKVALALAGLIVLTGCQNDPAKVATINGTTLTESTVQDSVRAVEANYQATPPQTAHQRSRADLYQLIVGFTVAKEAARRLAEEKGFPAPTPDYKTSAAFYELPETDPLVKAHAEFTAYRDLLQRAVTPATPTETDMRAVYDRYAAEARAANQEPAPYETDVRPALLESADYRSALGLRDQLVAAFDRYGLQLNPKYAPVRIPLYGIPNRNFANDELLLVELPVHLGTGAVADVS